MTAFDFNMKQELEMLDSFSDAIRGAMKAQYPDCVAVADLAAQAARLQARM